MNKKIQAMKPCKEIKITTDMVNAVRGKVKPGDVVPHGVVTGVYPFFMTVRPFGGCVDKMETTLWTDYYRQTVMGIKENGN